MITEIPTPQDFEQAGLNQLYLAWRFAIRAIQDHEEIETDHLSRKEVEQAATEYWSKLQPALANAFGLIQQSAEMGLKGRISKISPYLLISRDPKDWPSGVDVRPTPFSAFRTLDAADLVKVHNSFAPTAFPDSFKTFWDELRRDRNRIMHSVSSRVFDPTLLIRSALTVASVLFVDKRWPHWLLSKEDDDAFAAYGIGEEHTYNVVMGQIQTAVQCLSPAENDRFFGFNSRRRAYTCPVCWKRANRDWQEDWPKLAQLISRQPGETELRCIVCSVTTEVTRATCVCPDCKGNVIHEEHCLTCLQEQDQPTSFFPTLDPQSTGVEFCFSFTKPGKNSSCIGFFKNSTAAKNWIRQLLDTPALQEWQTASISSGAHGFTDVDVGTWVRGKKKIVWRKASESKQNRRRTARRSFKKLYGITHARAS